MPTLTYVESLRFLTCTIHFKLESDLRGCDVNFYVGAVILMATTPGGGHINMHFTQPWTWRWTPGRVWNRFIMSHNFTKKVFFSIMPRKRVHQTCSTTFCDCAEGEIVTATRLVRTAARYSTFFCILLQYFDRDDKNIINERNIWWWVPVNLYTLFRAPLYFCPTVFLFACFWWRHARGGMRWGGWGLTCLSRDKKNCRSFLCAVWVSWIPHSVSPCPPLADSLSIRVHQLSEPNMTRRNIAVLNA